MLSLCTFNNIAFKIWANNIHDSPLVDMNLFWVLFCQVHTGALQYMRKMNRFSSLTLPLSVGFCGICHYRIQVLKEGFEPACNTQPRSTFACSLTYEGETKRFRKQNEDWEMKSKVQGIYFMLMTRVPCGYSHLCISHWGAVARHWECFQQSSAILSIASISLRTAVPILQVNPNLRWTELHIY